MFYVYILTNKHNTVLYTGITNNLERRVSEHRSKIIEGFTKRYNIYKLVYYEVFNQAEYAIEREKAIKKLSHKNKVTLIEKGNAEWEDLFANL